MSCNNYRSVHPNEEESFSQSSDEKMDTSSESFRSQDTPNSILSTDSDERSDSHVLRLQNPENGVLRLSKPTRIDDLKSELTDSFVKKMSGLHIESPDPPKNEASPPKFSTSLVLTTSHPLMTSPDYPDVVPKKEQDLSLSSIEDERPNEPNGYNLYSPNTNNSKNNLYFSDNFVSADSNFASDSQNECNVETRTPDVARVEQQRRKIKPRFVEQPRKVDSTESPDAAPQRVLGRLVSAERDDNAILKYVEARNNKVTNVNHSTPKGRADAADVKDRVAEWCESSAQAPRFDLPIELTANMAAPQDLDSPDVLSSPLEDRSIFQALVEPCSGTVALRPRAAPQPRRSPTRRKIQLPPEEDDRCSVDSIASSLESDGGLADPWEGPEGSPTHTDAAEGTMHLSKSSNSGSEWSDAIPEYSAAEEFHNERSFVDVVAGGRRARCDMRVIEPYKRVLSHGGYDRGGAAIIVFRACFLPDAGRTDYRYVMDNLFLYVVWTLERLVGSEYLVVYLHGRARRLPAFRWLHDCYQLVDRRLRKSLKHLYLVHPTFWLKTFVLFTKPFVSAKFFRKLSYVSSLDQLQKLVPVDHNSIPEAVRLHDQGL